MTSHGATAWGLSTFFKLQKWVEYDVQFWKMFVIVLFVV